MLNADPASGYFSSSSLLLTVDAKWSVLVRTSASGKRLKKGKGSRSHITSTSEMTTCVNNSTGVDWPVTVWCGMPGWHRLSRYKQHRVACQSNSFLAVHDSHPTVTRCCAVHTVGHPHLHIQLQEHGYKVDLLPAHLGKRWRAPAKVASCQPCFKAAADLGFATLSSIATMVDTKEKTSAWCI